MVENRMVLEEPEYMNSKEYERYLEYLAEKDDQEWEDM